MGESALSQSTSTNVSAATICRFLQKQEFTYKKLSFRAQQRYDELRANFILYISFKPHMLIFIDETGTDKRTALHKYGHSFKGTRAVTDRLLGGGRGGTVLNYSSYVH